MNGDEANGPPWDLSNAPSASDKVNLRLAKKDDSTSRAACAWHPTLGWLGSPSATCGGWAVSETNSFQVGGVKPTATKLSRLRLMACTLGASSYAFTACIMVSTMSGWRAHTIFMVSAQLAQCAASRNLSALRKPNPPVTSGKLVAAFTLAATASGLILNRLQKHCQI